MGVEVHPHIKVEAKSEDIDLLPSLNPIEEVKNIKSISKTSSKCESSDNCNNADSCNNSSPFVAKEGENDKGSPTLWAFHQQRYDQFLKAYFGYDAEQRIKCVRQASQICVIGLSLQKKNQNRNGDTVHAARRFLRHSVLAVEGDAAFVRLVQRARSLWDEDDGSQYIQDPCQWPNARCIALHYGHPSTTVLPGEGNYHDDESAPSSSTTGIEERMKFPLATFMAVVATTPIEEGEAVRLCLRSYHRCLDEATWYEQQFGPNSHGSVARGVKRFHMWPPGLAFYHGVGARHAGAEPVAGFPFTLLDLAPATAIGEGEKGLFAAHPVPYATCFLYCGPAVATKVVEARRRRLAVGSDNIASPTIATGSHSTNSAATTNSARSSKSRADDAVPEDVSVDDATYALGMGRHGLCFGQGLMRYANHRYNLSNYGNVELCSVMLSVTSEFSPLAAALEKRRKGNTQTKKKTRKVLPQRRLEKSQKLGITENNTGGIVVKKKRYRPLAGRRVFLEEHSHFVTIPFFIATTDIEVGEQLLAWSYGEEYDARLERYAVCDGNIVPYTYAAVLDRRTPVGRWQRYKGDYRHGMDVGDIVWCCQSSFGNASVDPLNELFVIIEMQRKNLGYLLLRPLIRSSASHQGFLLHPDEINNDEMYVLDVCTLKTLERCVIAHVDTVGLLLEDIDYRTLEEAKRSSALSSSVSSPQIAGNGNNCGGELSSSFYHILIDSVALRRATRLVLESERVYTATSGLLNGRVWPFLQNSGEGGAHKNRKESVKSKKNGNKRSTS
ncbi:uncharacterized protein TM35_000351300 [Trypanosoma theileri]|uniref:SET domain-containing protein n=1 Tax=Trypanosoma theileri TaxID=67003 RepID=A0A1X0NL11_9TRYP|nr:uncharacterized protein TM35_000351300 [Trypanosoma theileri]ORC85386.1 hypothetical protein TM35_000351300 [Trypanosoma theileri]